MNLDQYRAQLAAILMDPNRLTWDASALDEALRQALAAYSASIPLTLEAVLTLPGGSAIIDLSSLPALVDVFTVEYPYREDRLTLPFPGWSLHREGLTAQLTLAIQSLPLAGEKLRLVYTACHTIAGLDSAADTTIHPADESLLVSGAAGYAAVSRAIQRGAGFEPAQPTSLDIHAWGRQQIALFEETLRARRSRSVGIARWESEE